MKIYNNILNQYKKFYKDCEIFFDFFEYETAKDLRYYLKEEHLKLLVKIDFKEIFAINKPL